MPNIKNLNYRKFLDTGMIDHLSIDMLTEVLKTIKGRYSTEARSMIICLYYSGARPNEILRLRSKDVTRDGTFINIQLPGSKGGLPRRIPISLKRRHIKEFYDYAVRLIPEMLLFFNFRNNYVRVKKTKSGEMREYIEISDKMRYFVNKWFSRAFDNSISPYYLRHDRLSKMAEKGASLQQMRLWKGSKTIDSIQPYLHLSKKMAQRASRFVD